ncbi:MAG: nucleoside triphosphate pyrophosphohydrolase [Chloroflexota bacterium]|nr:nucleoside triphosphate pyrophosphohydrolase [Chloroflexota bacterium]
MTLTIIGLGPSSADDVTRRAWRALETAETVFLRTREHPCVPDLPMAAYTSFDELYNATPHFDAIYTTIAARVLAAAQAGEVVYAVPGDPLVAEESVTRLIAAARAANVPYAVINGVSFIEPILALLEIDALDGLQLHDALTIAALHHPPLNPDVPALLAQVYSRQVASDLKLTLMNQYPDDFVVTLIHAAGTPDAKLERLALHEIDHSRDIRYLTALYVPALGEMSSFEQFQEIIAHLRAPEGCPWDQEQTHRSLRRYLLEETYEVLETLDADDAQSLSGELGDLLLQIVLHTQIAIDDGEFRMADVLRAVNAKMVRRHPHVFRDTKVAGTAEVLSNWDAIKKQERGDQEQRVSLLDNVGRGLPALMQGIGYQKEAAKVGFDWTNVADVIAKVREELDEVLTATTPEHRSDELGDLLFAIANWARHLKVDPETALRATNAKFYRRFRHIEQSAAAANCALADMTLDEMDALWNDAKAKGL